MTEAAALAYAQRTTGTDATPHLDTARHPDLLLVSAASDRDKRKTHSDGKHTRRGGKHVHGRRHGHQSSTAFPVDGTETLIDPAEVTTLSATSPSTTRAAGVAFPLSQPLPAEMQLPSHYPAIQALSIAPDKNRYSPIDQAFATADSVHAEWFRITDKGANAALATAKKNGADVLVVEDQKNMSGAAAQKAMKPLKDSGADVVMSSTGFDISHSKAGVVSSKANGRSTWIGSMNLTASNSRDVELNTNDPGIADSVDAVIKADVLNAKNGTTTTPTGLDPALVVSPVNGEDKIAGLIYSVDPDKSKGWVIASSENWGDPVIQKALKDVAAAGIPVRVLGPQCDENPNRSLNFPYMQDLNTGGVQARETPQGKPYAHLKMVEVMTADGPVGYVGSINFSFQSAHQGDHPIKSPSGRSIKPNRELGILFNDEAALTKIKQAFEQDWATSVAPAACSSGGASLKKSGG